MLAIGYGCIILEQDINKLDYQTYDLKLFKLKHDTTYVVFYEEKYLLTNQIYTNLNLESLKLSSTQIQKFKNIFIIEPEFYVVKISPEFVLADIKLITFNLNLSLFYKYNAPGQTINFGDLCVQKYGEDNGTRTCLVNSISWLAEQNADIIALQETAPALKGEIKRKFDSRYEIANVNSGFIVYNKIKLGTAIQIKLARNKFNKQESRFMMALWFDKTKLLVYNLRAPHNIDVRKTVETYLNAGNFVGLEPKRIIVMGDFNDTLENPLTELTILGKTLYQHSVPPFSCCTDSEYIYKGDYIFDTEYNIPGFYGVPEDAKTKFKYDEKRNPEYVDGELMSDHYPVVFYPTI